MTNSIFGETKDTPVSDGGNVADPVAPVISAEDTALLASIVDENGRQKYNSVADAMNGLQHDNNYIGSLHQKVDGLEGKNLELSEDLAARKSVADMMDTLAPGNPEPAPQGQVSAPAPEGLSAANAEELFNNLLNVREQGRVRDTNEKAVMAALQKRFGDNAEKVYVARATELAMTLDDLNNLSGTAPSAVLELFGTTTNDASLDVSGTVNSESLTGDPEAVTGRNEGTSVLMGSTSKDVRAEAERVKDFVAQKHAEGVTIAELTDPKKYFEHFGGS